MMLGLKGLTAEDFLNLFPRDFAIRLLPNIHTANTRWTDPQKADSVILRNDKSFPHKRNRHGYAYLALKEIARVDR